MIEAKQKEVKQKISEALRGGRIVTPRELWIEFYGDTVPTIEDFADCYRAAIDEPVKEVKTPKKDSE